MSEQKLSETKHVKGKYYNHKSYVYSNTLFTPNIECVGENVDRQNHSVVNFKFVD